MDDVRQELLFERLRHTISDERLGTYLSAAGFDQERALRLYIWNAQMGEAFHVPVQGVEVGLRNCVNVGLTSQFGPDWWRDAAFLAVADKERRRDIETAQRRIQKRQAPLTTSRIVATLSFGFWVGLLGPRYHPAVWSACLSTAFRGLPGDKSRQELALEAKRVSGLRNRIWHHEPVFRLDLSAEYHAVMQLLAWICPSKAIWLKPHCQVPRLLRQKP